MPITLTEFLRRSRVQWHGVRLGEPDWSDDGHAVAVSFQDVDGPALAYAIVNAWREPLNFELPPVETGWRQMVDTFLPTPDDIHRWEEAPVVETAWYLAGPQSVVFLAAESPARRQDAQMKTRVALQISSSGRSGRRQARVRAGPAGHRPGRGRHPPQDLPGAGRAPQSSRSSDTATADVPPRGQPPQEPLVVAAGHRR